MPWLTPTDTPGAMYFPALSAVPPVADVLVPAGFKVPVVAGAQFEKVEAETPAQAIEHAWTAAGDLQLVHKKHTCWVAFERSADRCQIADESIPGGNTGPQPFR